MSIIRGKSKFNKTPEKKKTRPRAKKKKKILRNRWREKKNNLSPKLINQGGKISPGEKIAGKGIHLEGPLERRERHWRKERKERKWRKEVRHVFL